MKKSSNLFSFIIMHFAFLVYCAYMLIGKIASKYPLISFLFIALYCVVFALLFVYALLWQQVLKKIPLTVAIANKSITIVWGMIFGLLIFKEAISFKMILGAIFILIGIFVLSSEKTDRNEEMRK